MPTRSWRHSIIVKDPSRERFPTLTTRRLTRYGHDFVSQTMSEHGRSFLPNEAAGTGEQTSTVPANGVTTPPLFARFRRSLRNRTSERLPATMREAQEVIRLCGVILSERGDVSGVRLAGEALAAYQALGPTARDAFFEILSGSFLPDPKFVTAAATAYQREPSAATLSRLQASVESPGRNCSGASIWPAAGSPFSWTCAGTCSIPSTGTRTAA
jgi:hypothetical protein